MAGIAIEGNMVANMTSDVVVQYLGRTDKWLRKHTPGHTQQQIRNALVERYNAITGSAVPTRATPGVYGDYNTVDLNKVAEAFSGASQVMTVTTDHTPLKMLPIPVSNKAASINNAATQLINSSPVAVQAASRKNAHKEMLAKHVQNQEVKTEKVKEEVRTKEEEIDELTEALHNNVKIEKED